MKKTASQIADYVLEKESELSEQDEANLEYINNNVDRPFGWQPYATLGGLFGGSAAVGSTVGTGSLKGGLKGGLIGGGLGLGVAGLIHALMEKNRDPMREQRDEILSRQ